MSLPDPPPKRSTAFEQLAMMREIRRYEIDPETRKVVRPSIASRMSARQISVWDSLALAADYETGITQWSITSICRAEGLSRSQTYVILKELETMGGVVRIRAGRGRQTSYKIALPSPADRTSESAQLVRPAGPQLVRSTGQTSPADRTLFVTTIRNHKSKKRTAPPAVVFPDPLDTPDFRAAWAEYLAYRRESRLRTLKPRSVNAQLAECVGWGHDASIESIRTTIAKGWHGIFEPKKDKSHDRPTPRPEDRGQFAEPAPNIRTRTAGETR